MLKAIKLTSNYGGISLIKCMQNVQHSSVNVNILQTKLYGIISGFLRSGSATDKMFSIYQIMEYNWEGIE
jgi:hypothetical protein